MTPFTATVVVVPIGKYAGRTVAWVVENDLGYARWMCVHWRREPVRSVVRAAVAAHDESREVTDPVPAMQIVLPPEGALDWLRQQRDDVLELFEAGFDIERGQAA